MDVGERIKHIREEKGISQEELATKMGLKDKSSVCKIEKAGDNISTKSIVKYANALGVTPALLMGWEEHIIPESDNPKQDQIERALNFCNKFDNAPPEVRSAISSLLGLDQ